MDVVVVVAVAPAAQVVPGVVDDRRIGVVEACCGRRRADVDEDGCRRLGRGSVLVGLRGGQRLLAGRDVGERARPGAVGGSGRTAACLVRVVSDRLGTDGDVRGVGTVAIRNPEETHWTSVARRSPKYTGVPGEKPAPAMRTRSVGEPAARGVGAEM